MTNKISQKIQLNRNNNHEEKVDYANFSHTRIITLFQVPQYEHIQILICNGNSLTTLAGIEHIKHLWKLDVGNNQIRSLQHLSRFIALGSLILSNNSITWMELQHIRHMCIIDFRIDGNPALDSDPNYRQHLLDCLPRIWMCDGVFVSTAERNEVDEFFTQSSFKQKPVRRKLARDVFMPTNLKDRSVNGLFGTKATEVFAKFPLNCFVNAELDKKRIKYLASTLQDLMLTEMKYENEKKSDKLLTENRHILYHMLDLRQENIEQFNMILILLITDILFQIPSELMNDALDVAHIQTIGNLNVSYIFQSSEKLKYTIASLVYAGARLDRDENHPSAFYDKLFSSLSVILSNQIRTLSSPDSNQSYPNVAIVSEAKSMICLEVMQVLIMCPLFYTLIDNSSVNAILKQALNRSPAYGSIRDVLQSFNADQKKPEEQKELLSPIITNILKMTIRTLSSKRTKKANEESTITYESTEQQTEIISNRRQEQRTPSPKPMQRSTVHRSPAIGDRLLNGPQSFGRIVTLPDSEIAMVQLDNILAVNGSMISNGTLNDHTIYVNINNFEWDFAHEYWKPKFALGDKITLQMTSVKSETPRITPVPMQNRITTPSPSVPSRIIHNKTPELTERGRTTPKLIELNINRPKDAFVDSAREKLRSPSPAIPILSQEITKSMRDMPQSPPPSPPAIEQKFLSSNERFFIDRPMSVRIIKQKQERHRHTSSNGEVTTVSPVLIESVLLLMPDQSSIQHMTVDQIKAPSSSIVTTNELEQSHTVPPLEHPTSNSAVSTSCRRAATQRVHVPVHNASQWFNGPNMQKDRTGRMERVTSSIVRRSFRPSYTYAMPRVPILTSPSSRDHAHYKGVRPGSYQDFCLESHRMTPTPVVLNRQSPSFRGRITPTASSNEFSHINQTHRGVYRAKTMLNPWYPTAL